MYISPKYKLHEVAGEHVILIHGQKAGDLSRILALNSTSLFLWNSLSESHFTEADAIALLTKNFEVDEQTAAKDASEWISTLKNLNIILDEQ